jgi:hypothetical protein
MFLWYVVNNTIFHFIREGFKEFTCWMALLVEFYCWNCLQEMGWEQWWLGKQSLQCVSALDLMLASYFVQGFLTNCQEK